MKDEILYQGPGYTIARGFVAETLVPYASAPRSDGNHNHGWIDLRDHPERVALVPEAQKSPGLARLLEVISAPESRIMSSACECAAFQNDELDPELRWYVGGFIEVMFRDGDLNADPQNLIDMAGQILTHIQPSSSHQISYEMIIEPLKQFFGRTDCFALMLKPLGHGPDEATAWSAFSDAAQRVASAIENSRSVDTA